MKKQNLKHIIFFALIFQIIINCPLYADDLLTPGNTLPEFEMTPPKDPGHCSYLGIEAAKKFTLSKIPAKLVVVEFFNVFCPKCHAQAPKANQIFALINGDPELKENVKMLGVGLLGKPDQMDAYQKKFDIAFPLIPDDGGQVVQTLKISAIPQTLIVDQHGKILANHHGLMGEVDDFMLETRKFLKQQ
jgi:peroxiredoxin